MFCLHLLLSTEIWVHAYNSDVKEWEGVKKAVLPLLKLCLYFPVAILLKRY
jgi:hypothetical protein